MAPSSTEMLAALVGFDTTSRNSNLRLINYVRRFLDGHGVPYRLSRDASDRKANLHAVIGPDTPGGVALSGHVDTVPTDGQDWTTDPFTLTRRGTRLMGRGTTDMKGFVACALAAVPDLLAAGLRRPVHLFITYDEEVGCLGAARLMQDLTSEERRPALCIVGEPSSMQPILAHKGRLAARVAVRGRPGHASEPGRGVNAIHAAARAIAWLADEARRLAAEGPFVDGFDPPHSTLQVGTVAGGAALNIIPEHASFDYEHRTVPGDDAEALLARLRAAAPGFEPGASFDIAVTNVLPAMSLDAGHELAGLVRQVTGSNSTGKVSYGTEGGVYQAAGIPSIVCGPGDIAQAHQPDEWIEESQLAECDAFIRRLAARLAA